MFKKLLKSLPISVVIFLMIATPIIASAYTAIITIVNIESEYDHVPLFLTLDNDYLIDNGYVGDDQMLDVRMDDGNEYLPMMPNEDGVWFCPQTIPNGNSYARWSSGNDVADSHQIVIGQDGYLYLQSIDLEEPTISTYGYLDDEIGYVFYSENTIELETDGDTISATSYGTLTDLTWDDSLIIGEYAYMQVGASICKIHMTDMSLTDIACYVGYVTDDLVTFGGNKGICNNGSTIYFCDRGYVEAESEFHIFVIVVDSSNLSVSSVYDLGQIDINPNNTLYYDGYLYIGGYTYYSGYYDNGIYKVSTATFTVTDWVSTPTVGEVEYYVLGDVMYRSGSYIYTWCIENGNWYVMSVYMPNMSIADISPEIYYAYGGVLDINGNSNVIIALTNTQLMIYDISDLSVASTPYIGISDMSNKIYVDSSGDYAYIGVDGIGASPSIYKMVGKYNLDTLSHVSDISLGGYYKGYGSELIYYDGDLFIFNSSGTAYKDKVYEIDLSAYTLTTTHTLDVDYEVNVSVEYEPNDYTIILQIEDGVYSLYLYYGEDVYGYDIATYVPNTLVHNGDAVIMYKSMPYAYYFKITESGYESTPVILYQPDSIIKGGIMPNLGDYEEGAPPA